MFHGNPICYLTGCLSSGCSAGAGPDGVEEIKRHIFFATIDWNVSIYKTLSISICVLNGVNCDQAMGFLSSWLTEVVQTRNQASVQTSSGPTRGHLSF